MIDFATYLLNEDVDTKATDLKLDLEILRQVAAAGITTIFLTPKIDPDKTGLDWQQIVRQTQFWQEAAQAAQLPLKIYPGAELALKHRCLELLNYNQSDYGMAGSHYVLVRMDEDSHPTQDYALLYELMLKGYRPILAAPENSRWVQAQPGRLLEWMHCDILIQVDLGSLSGLKGEKARTIAAALAKRKLITFSGSHAAQAQDYRLLGSEAGTKLLGPEQAAVMEERAELVVADQVFYQELPHRW